MPTVADVVAFLDAFAPPRLAADWDNVGLLLGDAAAPVERAMTCLTVTPNVAEEALASGAQLLVSHHPILFRPIQRLTTATSEGRMLLSLARAGVAIHSPHTAFDNTHEGINDLLARRLNLGNVGPLKRGPGEGQYKLVVFVPESDLARVADALFAAGAGHIGQYSECSFRLPGTGTFFGSDAANPTIGQKGRREEVNEWRLEVVCPEPRLEAILAALRKAHSYEEPAFDVYPLRPRSATQGEGRLGRLPEPLPLRELAERLKRALGVHYLLAVGSETERKLERVAIVCGAGGSFLKDAVRARADVLVTGEMRFHDCLTAATEGIAVLLPGHHATERCGVEELAERLQRQWPQLHVWASRNEQDPVRLL